MRKQSLNKALAFLLFLTTGPTFAVAYLKIDKAASSYALTRDGKALNVVDGMYLKPGDTLILKDQTAKAAVVMANGSVKPLEMTGSQKILAAPDLGGNDLGQRTEATWNAAVDWLLVRVGARDSGQPSERIIQASARSLGDNETLLIPLGQDGGLRITEKKQQPLHVAWSGGHAPFILALKDAVGQPIALEKGIASHRFTFENLSLKPGNYQLEIAGGEDQISMPLAVVGASGSATTQKKLPSTDSERQNLLIEAMTLAKKGNGWAFESYQIAANLAPSFPFAQIYLEALESGDIPSP